MNSQLKELVKFRVEQADESLESAKILMDNGKYRPSVNRSYYAMFYAVLALLAAGETGTSKHSGLIALFDREYVKTGLFAKDFSRWLHEAFDLRQRADYRELFIVTDERAAIVLEHAAAFVAAVKKYLNKATS